MPRLNPVYLAALALVGIQVGIGLIYKLAQRGGRLVIFLITS